jgi:hypothetical protein
MNKNQLESLLESLSPEREDPFPYLAFLRPDELLKRRVEVTKHIKLLEKERQVIDEEIASLYSESELRRGIQAPGGFLQQRTRSSWEYPREVRDVIKHIQRESQVLGSAQQLTSTYLCLIEERS